MPILNTALTLKDLPPPPPEKSGWPWTELSQPLPERTPDDFEWPRISIVTPSYNYGQFIEETIRSVLLQGYPNLEYIIIDGGSTDNTVEIIQKYEKYLAYWVSEPDEGQTDAINKGYQYCTGELFAWLNADDAYANSNCLQNVGEIYKQGYQLIIGECLNVDGNDEVIKITEEFNGYSPPQNFDQYLRFWSCVHLPQPAVFISKKFTDKSFPLDKAIYIAMDYQLFLRIFSQNPKAVWVKQIWVKFKYHGENKTMKPHEGYPEFYRISLSEAQKTYKFWNKMLFTISAKDFLIIALEMMLEPKPIKLLVSLIYRPTLIRWPIFWKLFIKASIGTNKYLALKNLLSANIYKFQIGPIIPMRSLGRFKLW